jgi:AraC family transcriptional regulator
MQVKQTAEQLYPVFVYIQSHLADDLSLEQVAGQADLSPFHFHRLFHGLVGETLKQYTQRLRLEQAAYHLKIQDASILDVALNAGFNNHETFSRAFKRWFGVPPKQFRQSFGRSTQDNGSTVRDYLNKLATDFQLSRVTIKKLNPLPVAFIRNLGPYVDVDVSLFERLQTWADREGHFTGENLFLGVGHDDPNITAIEKVRFDLCLAVSEPFRPDGEVGFQTIGGGYFAAASYIGPFGPTLEAAYFQMVQQIMTLENIEFIGLPAIEIYQTTNINPAYALNHTEILLPVRPLNNQSSSQLAVAS